MLFARKPFRWVFLDETALLRGPPHALLRFVAGSLWPQGRGRWGNGVSRPCHKRFIWCGLRQPDAFQDFAESRLPGSGWFGCGTKTFLNIPSRLYVDSTLLTNNQIKKYFVAKRCSARPPSTTSQADGTKQTFATQVDSRIDFLSHRPFPEKLCFRSWAYSRPQTEREKAERQDKE